MAGGGTGEVYRAVDRELERRVAVKLLDRRYATDPELQQRFTREALAAARLSAGPNTVTIFDVGRWRGRPYIVMEYLPQAGTILGTSGYLAPEQADGRPVTAAADRFALAVVAFELLTGRRPLQRESPTAEAAAQLAAPIPSVTRCNGELPIELDATGTETAEEE